MFDLRRSTSGAPFRWIGHRPCEILHPRLLSGLLCGRASAAAQCVLVASLQADRRASIESDDIED